MTDLERGTVRPASADYALDAVYENRGKLGPCPACGDAPDHRPDDQKCVERRVLAVRAAREAQERLLEAERRCLDAVDSDLTGRVSEQLRRLMVD